MEKRLRFGIIGLGSIARRFAAALQTAPSAVLYAVASRSMDKASAFKDEFAATAAYDSYEALVNDPNVDAVYVALPHNFHFDAAMLAINHHKAVLCEKPMVVTKQEAEALFAAAKEKGVFLSEAMWSHTLPTYQKALDWIKEGKIGKVNYIDAAFCFNLPFTPTMRHYDPALAGGGLLDAGVYSVEFALGIMGKAPSKVTASALFAPTGVDRFASVTMEFDGEAIAHAVSAVGLATVNDGYIYGEKGYIHLPGFIGCKAARLYGERNRLLEEFEITFKDGFSYQIEQFAQCFFAGKTENDMIPAWETIACAEVFDKVFSQWK